MDLLPLEKKDGLAPEHFPFAWQAVIFRNWGKIAPKQIAEVLETDSETVIQEAERLGISKIPFLPEWRKRGYLTILRENWHLLSYRQLIKLLEIDEEILSKWLYNEDFLFVKLGGHKPDVAEPKYTQLTEENIRRTEEISNLICSQDFAYKELPFAFNEHFKKLAPPVKPDFARGRCLIEERIVHAYLGGSGDLLELDVEACFPDSYLSAVAARGITGLFVHAVLNQLSEFPFDLKLSKGFNQRRAVLNEIVERLRKYGISLYLYLNEPRGLPLSFFKTNPKMLGHVYDGLGALCTSLPEVKDYLFASVRDLFAAVSGLGGVITITMSENLTNCYSRAEAEGTSCLRCAGRNKAEVVAEVNSIIESGMRAAGSKSKLIAWNWGWNDMYNFSEAETEQAIAALPKDAQLLCNSEEMLPIRVGCVEDKVFDYTISQSGRAPSPYTRKVFAMCDKQKRKKYAKIQLNNSWECCAPPFLPVFELNRKHLEICLNVKWTGFCSAGRLAAIPRPIWNSIRTLIMRMGKTMKSGCQKPTAKTPYISVRRQSCFPMRFQNFPLA